MTKEYVLHESLTFEMLLDIISIKSTAWNYRLEDHLKWNDENLKKGDVHVLMRNEEGRVIAYLNLIKIELNINQRLLAGYGIGNVCALHKGNGDGSALMKEVNEFLQRNNLVGVILCKDNHLDFYKKMDWQLLERNTLEFENLNNGVHVLIHNYDTVVTSIRYEGKLF